MQPNRMAYPLPHELAKSPANPVEGPRIMAHRNPDEEAACQPARFSKLSDELERSQRELDRARDRIAELTKSQFELSGTVGRLTELASTDVLTGLSNRRHLVETLESAFNASVVHNSPLSIIMLDVDCFKSYNDSFGHPAGDHVIWVVAKLLLRTSGSDHVVARHGGEEFAVLLPSTDQARAMEFAERQRLAIESYPWPSRQITASFGVTTTSPATRDSTSLLEEADLALYRSKRMGKNRISHHREFAAPDSCPGVPDRPALSPGSRESNLRLADPEPATHPLLEEQSVMPNVPTLSWPNQTELADRQRETEAAWEALERFLQALQCGSSATDPYRDVLSAIRDATDSEIVFVCSDLTGDVFGTVGDHVPTNKIYQDLTRLLISELPGGGIHKPSESDWKWSSAEVPEPAAAMVLPVKVPKACWLVVLRFRNYQSFLPADLRVARVLWQLHVNHHRHDRVHDVLKETLFGVVRCLSATIDAKDPYTCGHSERVARIAVRLGEEMGLSRGEISDLYLAGLLHDLGKIGIRDDVLCKEGPLTPEEYLHIQEHPVTGERIIANVTRLAYLRPGVRGHHERFDGKGYPDGLAGEAIPRMARILAVADACDAMMSARRYRAALSPSRIEEIFRADASSQWDPQIVDHFLACRHELFAVIQRGLGQSVYIAVERAVGSGETLNGNAGSMNLKYPSHLRSR